jgi:carboxylate-amine ligase
LGKPTADHLRAAFDEPAPMTIGVEEELMLLDARTLDLAPRAPEVLAALGGDPRFKLEMPASQVEIVLPPLQSAAAVRAPLLAARRRLAEACAGLGLRPAGAGVHPFAAPVGELNRGERYERMLADFGDVARSQLVCALQVHVCVRPSARALAVHNALRAWLPAVAALAANAPVHDGRDTGLASVRPSISERLPRQGMPPALTWESYAEALGALPDPARWWWELRPHPRFGTLEVRVPDAQATVDEAVAVAAVVHALVAWVAEDPGRPPPAGDLEADRRAAARHGAGGPFRARLHALLDELAPVARRLGCARELASARRMVAEGGGAGRQRAAFAGGGARRAVEDLADRFAAG